MNLEGIFRVTDVRPTPYRGIVRLEMEGEEGIRIGLEYPEEVLGVKIEKGSSVKISIKNEKDPNYKENWDVYMNGIVYHIRENIVKVSIGGLILDVYSYKGDVRLGEKVYIGLKIQR